MPIVSTFLRESLFDLCHHLRKYVLGDSAFQEQLGPNLHSFPLVTIVFCIWVNFMLGGTLISVELCQELYYLLT